MVSNDSYADLKQRLEVINSKFEDKELTAPVASALSLKDELNATIDHIINSNHNTEAEFEVLSNTVGTLEAMLGKV